ncbi:MAG: flagellar motor protein [Acidobacteria bacterium]|nr:flagellar motor protein [Acidobacteriota bacterium]
MSEPIPNDLVKKDPPPARTVTTRPDLATICGLLLAAAGILGGMALEGGNLFEIAQITAAMIVLGGTFGAVLISSPIDVAVRAIRKLPFVFIDRSESPAAVIEQIIEFASKARKNGIVALEAEVELIPEPFLRKAMTLAVDGTDLTELRKMMELEISLEEQRAEAEVKVYEAAGGYAPTIGIIGAVLGLIQVMKHIENVNEVGKGIAVAFVATIYGVSLANIFCLPAANKLKSHVHRAVERRELILEGVIGIVEGLNPKLIRSKLDAYGGAAPRQQKPKEPEKEKKRPDARKAA